MEIYEGQSKNGTPDGFGRYIDSEGGYYIGWFKDGIKHGQGKDVSKTLPNGKLEGLFRDGKFIGSRDKEENEDFVESEPKITGFFDEASYCMKEKELQTY